MATQTEAKDKIVLDQFKRNLSHIQINTKDVGPEITIGTHVFKFKSKPPVTALGILVGDDNRVEGMVGYITRCLVPGQEEEFMALLEEIDIEGLSEILNALGEGYTSFPDQS
jgi:hypothetical protein